MAAHWGVCAVFCVGLSVASAILHEDNRNPGVGIGEVTPFKHVFKDGYARVECVLDDMFLYGDKHGNNKDQYKLETVSNVSIAHYSENIPKLDRKPMTPAVCFDFCRTVDGMDFFGIRNGRDCYCEPFYRTTASDSEDCDEVCDGDHSQICGGKSKSQIFSMHMGADALGDLEAGVKRTGFIAKNLGELKEWFIESMDKAEKDTKYLEGSLGSIQDFAATNMLRQAWNRAYDLNKMAKTAGKVVDDLEKLSAHAQEMVDSDTEWTKYENAKKAEATVAEMKALADKGQAAYDELYEANKLYQYMNSTESIAAHEGRGQNYYHAYYFAMDDPNAHPHTKKNWGQDKSTCSGDLLEVPIFGMDEDSCAHRCDSTKGCVGYQFYSKETEVCMLLGHVHDVSHYDACRPLAEACAPPPPSNKVSFLQKDSGDDGSGPASFVWKTKSKMPNYTMFADATKGMCVEVHGCEGTDQAVSDCSPMDSYWWRGKKKGPYECIATRKEKVEEAADGTVTMSFSGWVRKGKRKFACSVNPENCGICKKYSSCSGPYLETEPMIIKKDDVAKYQWSSAGAVDNYEVFVGLYSETCGLVDYQFQRGEKQEMRAFELFAPKTDKYYVKFMLASYDGTGGGALGADMVVKGVHRDKPSRPPPNHQAKCMVKFNKFDGMDLRPRKQKCEYCYKHVQNKCLKPDGSFPEPLYGPKMDVDGRIDSTPPEIPA